MRNNTVSLAPGDYIVFGSALKVENTSAGLITEVELGRCSISPVTIINRSSV